MVIIIYHSTGVGCKCPASGEWFGAIIYQECNTDKLYVRGRKDFLDKFVKLTEI